jgi:hypothetical protein
VDFFVKFSFFYIATLFSGIPNFLMRIYIVSADTMYLIKKKVVYINAGKKIKNKKIHILFKIVVLYAIEMTCEAFNFLDVTHKRTRMRIGPFQILKILGSLFHSFYTLHRVIKVRFDQFECTCKRIYFLLNTTKSNREAVFIIIILTKKK